MIQHSNAQNLSKQKGLLVELEESDKENEIHHRNCGWLFFYKIWKWNDDSSPCNRKPFLRLDLPLHNRDFTFYTLRPCPSNEHRNISKPKWIFGLTAHGRGHLHSEVLWANFPLWVPKGLQPFCTGEPVHTYTCGRARYAALPELPCVTWSASIRRSF